MLNPDKLTLISSIMLESIGGDIVAPKEIANGIISTLDLEEDNSFINISKELDAVDSRKQIAIIKALFLTRLTTGELMRMHKLIHAAVQANLEYLKQHPEARKDVSSEEPCDLAFALAALFGKD